MSRIPRSAYGARPLFSAIILAAISLSALNFSGKPAGSFITAGLEAAAAQAPAEAGGQRE
jgi:hypothetical protein